MKILKIDGVDNRGNEEIAFGFIYFNDGTRISFHNTSDKDTGEARWNTGGNGGSGWPGIEEWHQERAQSHLRQHGARMPSDTAA